MMKFSFTQSPSGFGQFFGFSLKYINRHPLLDDILPVIFPYYKGPIFTTT